METKKKITHEPVKAVLEFLKNVAPPKELATQIRHANYMLTLYVMRSTEKTNPIDKERAEDCFYWLNEVAETLHPVLEEENYLQTPHNPLNEIKEQLEQIIEPFNLAKHIRRAILILTISGLKSEIEECKTLLKRSADAIYFLNEFAETLHPILED
jgi:hypothetical protein